MIDVLRAADVKRQDAAAEQHGVSIDTLMGNAGFAVARAARALLGGCYGRRVVVICGKGNNGGDGLVAARVLASWGARVTVVLVWPDLTGLPAEQRARFTGPVLGVDDLEREVARADLAIDAVFGVGLARAPEGDAARAIALLGATDAPVLAVDVPSGVDSDTGRVYEPVVAADATVTFGGAKPGLLFMPGAAHAGVVEVADIGLPSVARGNEVRALEPDDVRALVPVRGVGTNKRRVGTVLVVAGSRAMPGAAALVCRASVAMGAGLTTLLAPEDVAHLTITRVPEMTTIPVPASPDGTLDAKGLELLRPRLDEFHAIACGPGLSMHPAAVEAVRAIAAETAAPMVLDADGLNAFAGATDLLRAREGITILTPHAGELSRLLERDASDIEADRLGAATEAADRFGAVVVLKGPGTVIADTDGSAFVNMTGSEALAQGGTGDVLTGLLASLVAQAAASEDDVEVAPLAAAGVWLHGRAADRISARGRPQPARASLLADEIGPALHEVMIGG